jgi:hypothetical protein
MKPFAPSISMILCFTLSMLSVGPGSAATTKEAGVPFPMKYEGGSLPLNQHDNLTSHVSKDEVVLVQGKQRFVVPVKNITEVSYGNDVHRRVGAAVGVGLVTLGIGALLLLVKTKKHYVGIVWSDQPTATGADTNAVVANQASAGKGGVVFKVGKGDYRGFLKALEGITGKQAVNADAEGGGGTSKQ